jgi:hypothetical protein
VAVVAPNRRIGTVVVVRQFSPSGPGDKGFRGVVGGTTYRGQPFWECRCDCGLDLIIAQSSLTNLNARCPDCDVKQQKSATTRSTPVYGRLATTWEEAQPIDPPRSLKPDEIAMRYGVTPQVAEQLISSMVKAGIATKIGRTIVARMPNVDSWFENNHITRRRHSPSRLRVTAIYPDGIERELSPFPVSDDGLTGFEIDGEEYVAFIARVPREQPAQSDVVEFVDGNVPF